MYRHNHNPYTYMYVHSTVVLCDELRMWVCVIFVVVDGEDYQHFSSVVTFEKEEIEVRRRVRILDNHVLESTKTFSVVIEVVPGIFPVAVTNSTAAVEIKDDDCECLIGYSTNFLTAVAKPLEILVDQLSTHYLICNFMFCFLVPKQLPLLD